MDRQVIHGVEKPCRTFMSKFKVSYLKTYQENASDLIWRNHSSAFLEGGGKHSLFDIYMNAICHPPTSFQKNYSLREEKIPPFNCN